MNDITIGAFQYRTGRLSARQQLHVARRLAATPLQFLLSQQMQEAAVPAAVAARAELAGFNPDEIQNAIPRLLPTLTLRALGEMSEVDCDYVINTCLGVVKRQAGSNGVSVWADVMNAATGLVMYQDVGLDEMLQLTIAVLRENLSGFFDADRSSFPGLSPPIPQMSTG